MKKTILFSLLITFALHGFSRSSKGKEFWIGFMENIDLSNLNPPDFQLHVSSEFATTCTISIPLSNFSATFAVAPQQVFVYTLPTGIWYPQGDEVAAGVGIHLVSQDSVQVKAFHQRQYFTESTLILPVHELAREYLVTCNDVTYPAGFTELVVVALRDSTVVEIFPTVNTLSNRPAGFPFTATLQAGQAYQIQSFNDLSGTSVWCLDPLRKVAVFSGAVRATIGCTSTANESNHVYEQMYPINSFGKKFFAVPFKSRHADVVKIVACQNSTSITVSNGQNYTIARGQAVSFTLTSACEITADKPVSVAHFATSLGCDFSEPDTTGGEGMIMLQPSNQAIKSCNFYTPTHTNYGNFLEYKPTHFVSLLVKTGAIGSAKLDNAVIPSTSFSAIPSNALYSYARLTIDTLGILQHTLACDSGVSAEVYCFTYANFYGHHLGFAGPTTPYNGTGIAEEYLMQSQLYPNPSTSNLSFNSKVEMVSYTITDITGRVLDSQNLSNCTSFEIDLSKQLPGYYSLHIRYTDGSISSKSFMKLAEN